LFIVIDIHISQGSVATHLRCGGIFNDFFIASFSLSLTVKEFWKSVNIWRNCGQECNVSFFWLTVYICWYVSTLYCLLWYAVDDARLRRRAQDGRERNIRITRTAIIHITGDNQGLDAALPYSLSKLMSVNSVVNNIYGSLLYSHVGFIISKKRWRCVMWWYYRYRTCRRRGASAAIRNSTICRFIRCRHVWPSVRLSMSTSIVAALTSACLVETVSYCYFPYA